MNKPTIKINGEAKREVTTEELKEFLDDYDNEERYAHTTVTLTIGGDTWTTSNFRSWYKNCATKARRLFQVQQAAHGVA